MTTNLIRILKLTSYRLRLRPLHAHSPPHPVGKTGKNIAPAFNSTSQMPEARRKKQLPGETPMRHENTIYDSQYIIPL